MTRHRISSFARMLALALCGASVSVLGWSVVNGTPQLMPRAAAVQTEEHGKAAKENYDLSSLEILRKVVVSIKDNYVDAKRIKPKDMFLAALEAVEKSTAEVMVEGNAAEGRVKVTCGNAVKDFKFDDVESIWMIPHRMK